jgi:DNA-binding transcriptional LysR family regulator
LELRHLRYFDAVATERNFTRAAERLGIAQPPLSRQIRDLEIELGVSLFERGTRPVKLTEAGRLFHEQAAQVLANFEQMRQSMKLFAAHEHRRYVIGFVGSVAYGAMPEMIRTFRSAAPQVEVHLVGMTTVEQISALRDGRIDAGIGRIRVEDPGVRRVTLSFEPLVAALAADHPLAVRGGSLALKELVSETLVVYPSQPRPSYADFVLRLLRDHGLRPSRVSEVRDVQTALGLVAAQLGCALVPATMDRLQRSDIAYRALEGTNIHSPIILSTRIGDVSEATRTLEQIGRQIYSEEPASAAGNPSIR